MLYISTRGDKQELTFSQALLKGLAPDGGLYIPKQLPTLSQDLLEHGHNMALLDFAVGLLSPFIIGDKIFNADNTQDVLHRALKNSLPLFGAQTEQPWQAIDKNIFLLELFHGPTLSFKDVAMQFLAPLFEHVLTAQNKKITILAATSGDTGSAAIEAFRQAKNTEVVVFHPEGKVSAFQRKQMTTVQGGNIHNIALRGSFDDCQDMVKKLFADHDMVTRYGLTAVNSINWGRVLMQMVYHARASVMLFAKTKQKINIAVPSGNFGNILAGYYAKCLGFPINKLLVATNENDILYQFFAKNNMVLQSVKKTHSPSMDIQISSNLERYMYYLFNQDSSLLKEKMLDFRTSGRLILSPSEHQQTQQDFVAMRVDNDENLQTMKDWFDKTQKVFDPHSAIALRALEKYKTTGGAEAQGTSLCLATADARKFESAVQAAGLPLPMFNADIEKMLQAPEKLTALDNNFDTVCQHLRDNLI